MSVFSLRKLSSLLSYRVYHLISVGLHITCSHLIESEHVGQDNISPTRPPLFCCRDHLLLPNNALPTSIILLAVKIRVSSQVSTTLKLCGFDKVTDIELGSQVEFLPEAKMTLTLPLSR